jgi:hypothetical protein
MYGNTAAAAATEAAAGGTGCSCLQVSCYVHTCLRQCLLQQLLLLLWLSLFLTLPGISSTVLPFQLNTTVVYLLLLLLPGGAAQAEPGQVHRQLLQGS